MALQGSHGRPGDWSGLSPKTVAAYQAIVEEISPRAWRPPHREGDKLPVLYDKAPRMRLHWDLNRDPLIARQVEEIAVRESDRREDTNSPFRPPKPELKPRFFRKRSTPYDTLRHPVNQAESCSSLQEQLNQARSQQDTSPPAVQEFQRGYER